MRPTDTYPYLLVFICAKVFSQSSNSDTFVPRSVNLIGQIRAKLLEQNFRRFNSEKLSENRFHFPSRGYKAETVEDLMAYGLDRDSWGTQHNHG